MENLKLKDGLKVSDLVEAHKKILTMANKEAKITFVGYRLFFLVDEGEGDILATVGGFQTGFKEEDFEDCK